MAAILITASYYAIMTWQTVIGQCRRLCPQAPPEGAIRATRLIYRPKDRNYDAFPYPLPDDIPEDYSEEEPFDMWNDVGLNPPQDGDVLEVHYNVCFEDYNKNFIMLATYPDQPRFPPYTIEKIKEYAQSDDYKIKALSAFEGKVDLTSRVQQYAGPLENFYRDIDGRIPKHLVGRDTESDLLVTDTLLQLHTFKNSDILDLHTNQNSQDHDGNSHDNDGNKHDDDSQDDEEYSVDMTKSVLLGTARD